MEEWIMVIAPLIGIAGLWWKLTTLMVTKVELAAVKTDLSAATAEVKTDVVSVRPELKAEIGSLRSDMVGLKADLKAKNAELRADIRGKDVDGN